MSNSNLSPLLSSLVPTSNRLELAFQTRNGSPTCLMEQAYHKDAGFVGAFSDRDELPSWARRAAQYMQDDFFHNTPGTKKLFSDIANSLADGDGERSVNCRHALELWEANGRKGPEPFTCQQDYGSCVDASASEHMTSIFGWRAAQLGLNESYLWPSAWYWYANRGYCSDGWGGSGIAAVALRMGCAFRVKYELPGGSIDFTDDDENEQVVARTWCRSGIPDWLGNHTQTNHPFEDGAITSYNGDHTGFKKILKAGGALHAGGVRTSGGSKPFTNGRTGAHMQSTVGYDDTDECRAWFKDNHNITWATGDFPLIQMQTWGPNWSGECADKYWPTHLWGPKPEGAWVCSAKWWLGDVEYAWLPRVKGFKGTGPVPSPQGPAVSGKLFADQAGQAIAVRGEFAVTVPAGQPAGTYKYIVVPDGTGTYRPIAKPIV